ncbi:hypothetical protein AAEX63_11560 [Luteococcus sp. H138]|uniref:hypothetical protein n=1 Tax=unclassified Luteococcus TaxID=2639923 RepID=UPI00313D981B
MTTRRVLLPLLALAPALILCTGCLHAPEPLVEHRDAVLTVHTYGHATGSWTPRQDGRHVLRANCTGKGTMTVEQATGDRVEGVVLRCPSSVEQAAHPQAAGQSVRLSVRGDAKSVDGWAQLVPATS